jgi:predicted MFS family arabinose efflux permease
VDWLGAITFSAALFMLVFALIRGNAEGWGSTTIVVLFVETGLLLIAFIALELRNEQPMLDLSLFRKPSFAGASVAAFSLSAGMISLFLYIVLYIQNVLGYSPLATGVRFLPLSITSFFVAPLAGRLSARLPARSLLGGGLIVVGIGLLLQGGISDNSDWTTLLAGFIVAGAGIGTVNPTLAQVSIAVVDPRKSGMASGINNTFRQVGLATGIAALGAIFQSHVQDKVITALSHSPVAAQATTIAHAVSSGAGQQSFGNVPAQARALVQHAARDAFISGLNELFVVGAVIAFVGALLSLILVRQSDFVGYAQQPAEAGA